jgi:CRISPR-associated endonuclease/helicase Cas3
LKTDKRAAFQEIDPAQIDLLFTNLTTFSPRGFQRETVLKLLQRQDVLLRAPTGSGKTETAIAPFLFAKALNLDFPNKLIYIVPLRTLATSLRDRVEAYVRDWEKIHKPKRPLVVTLQTGENPEDPRFEGDIIFCTIDQMLSSFLNIPYSVGRGSANVNAGAIFASYLVFDELHLLDPDRSFATTLELLRQVQGISPFLLMTATLTKELAEQIQAEIKGRSSRRRQSSEAVIHLMKVEVEDLQAIETRRRYFEPVSTPLTAHSICEDIDQEQRKRVIVLCNTVAQSQGLFKDLRDSVKDQSVKVSLLHSRFLPSDRKVKEESLKKIFGKEAYQEDEQGYYTSLKEEDGYCQILISTQVIEAGIDITCDVMHTMLCPMNSLLQRAGRCARFAGQVGIVRVYQKMTVDKDLEKLAQSEEDDDQIAEIEQRSRRKFLPYDDLVCESTRSVLQNHIQSPIAKEPVGFAIEADWVNEVHEKGDRQQAQKRQDNRDETDKHLVAAMFSGETSAAKYLIRHVDNCSIYMETSEIGDLRKLQAFSVPRSTLLKVWREFQKSQTQDWIFKKVVQPEGEKGEGYSLPHASPVKDSKEIAGSFRLIVNSKYVSYDKEVGLCIGVNGNYLSETSPVKFNSREYIYHMDTYVEHLRLMWVCWQQEFPSSSKPFQGVRDELLQAGGRFIQRKIFRDADLEQTEALFELLVFLAVFTHDLGKLQVKWQESMRGWQAIAHQYFNGKNPRKLILAHSDYDPTDESSVDNEGKAQRKSLKAYEKKHPRPNHAVESAFLANEILEAVLIPVLDEGFQADEDVVDSFCKVIEMAVGRHHSAWSKGWQSDSVAQIEKIRLHQRANREIAQSWQLLSPHLPKMLPLPKAIPALSHSVYQAEEIELDCFNPDPCQMRYQQLYWLVVRGLRLCDTRSVQIEGSERISFLKRFGRSRYFRNGCGIESLEP